MPVLKDALRKCGHREDYEWSRPHRLEEFALLSNCLRCKQAEEAAANEREKVKRAIALRWISDHGIKLEPHIDASSSYSNAVQVTFYIPTDAYLMHIGG